jgi:phasin
MSKQAFEPMEVPAEMRAFAEKSVEQARKAFDGFVAAANQAASSFEGHAAVAQTSARNVTQKAMSFAEQNVETSFDFLQNLMRAKDIGEVVRLHSDYAKKQISALSEQAKELGESASRMTSESAKRKGR